MKISTGSNIKFFRRKRGFSRSELANKLNISVHTITKYEQGQREVKAVRLSDIAKILNVDIKN
ncbi:helix-turn-helix domain-containing protein [Clostridioides mangenotii]|uniref:helix-turn-helix domain-containing protein n=1 Tax=Metaclostridioides mangenotii TaxID=1540 RepID=UPI001C0FE5D6|nr:helix-turn-helix domain-containing protein [Clostridioides mangenotii]